MLSLLMSTGSFILHFNVKDSFDTPWTTPTTDVKSSADVIYSVTKTVLASNDLPYAVS